MKQYDSRLLKLERFSEAVAAPPTYHVVIYDAATGATLNGAIPASAEHVFYIPSNEREPSYDNDE